jgi:hypothetical protein
MAVSAGVLIRAFENLDVLSEREDIQACLAYAAAPQKAA